MPNKNTFDKKYHLIRKEDFNRLYEQGNRIQGRIYQVYFLPSPEQVTRIGITVTGKMGNSVFRNLQKRIIREFFRVEKLSFLCPLDIVFHVISKPQQKSIQQAELSRLFDWLKSITFSEGF